MIIINERVYIDMKIVIISIAVKKTKLKVTN